MRFAVDPWDPSYGQSVEGALALSEIEVNVEVERPAGEWAPIDPPRAEGRPPVVFVDGVRRVEARIWIETGEPGSGEAAPGLVASFAAGAVRCAEVAGVVEARVGRVVVAATRELEAIPTRHAVFEPCVAASDTPEALSLALQECMTRTEVEIAERARRAGDELIVLDGPLRGRQHLPHTVGFVKTHHVTYLPPELHRVVGRLGAGQRSPVFTMHSSWTRHSWYLRLPTKGASSTAPWSGIARCEVAPNLSPADAVALADRVSALVPRFASEQYKDSRAPQNLYPIAGLERALRRRLGSPELLYRALVHRVGREKEPT